MSWEGRNVVVTGGAGFIGSHLSRALVERGAHVTVIDDLSTGRIANLADVRASLEFVHGSTLDVDRVARAMDGAHVVFHLAAVLGVKRTWEQPVRVIHENLTGTHTVLRAAADAGVHGVVLASSSEVYGDGEPPYSDERTLPAPQTGYAAAKFTEEKLAEAFTSETGLRTACLRYFNAYGPAQESSAYGFVTAIFCDRVSKGLPPVIFGDGEQTRDFTFVKDLVEGTLLAAERGGPHEVFSLGTGVETSIQTLAEAVARAAGKAHLRPTHAPARADEVRRRVADASKAQRILGWRATTPLDEGLRMTLAPTLTARPLVGAV